jgi:GT2 family glycosyltransferase
VIPVYNHLDHSLTCLRSIAAHPSRIAAEIIVVDDCSSDDTEATLPQIEGLRYQRNPQNLGFIGACNAGAAAARGDYLVFLNNDTAVQPGWLDALVETFDTQERVGLVGAKLIYPDGRLQEAGGIVFSDASGWSTTTCARSTTARVQRSPSAPTCSPSSAASTDTTRRPITKTPTSP